LKPKPADLQQVFLFKRKKPNVKENPKERVKKLFIAGRAKNSMPKIIQ